MNSENGDGKSINSSPSVSQKDSLIEICKQTTPRILLHRISCSTTPRKSNESVDSGNCLQITSSYDSLIESPSMHPERSLLIQTPPPEPSFGTSTPILTRNLNSYSSDFSARRERVKRSSSEREISPDTPRHKILRDSMS